MMPDDDRDRLTAFHEYVQSELEKEVVEKGQIYPTTTLFTHERPPSEIHGATLKTIDDEGPIPERGDFILFYPHQLSTTGMINVLCTFEPKLKLMLPVILDLGKRMEMDEDAARAKFLEMALKQFRMTEPDVIALGIKYLARDVKAHGLVKADEAWVAMGPPEETQELYERHGSIKDIPGRGEAVMSYLELRDGFRRLRMSKVLRDESGKVSGIGRRELLEGKQLEAVPNLGRGFFRGFS